MALVPGQVAVVSQIRRDVDTVSIGLIGRKNNDGKDSDKGETAWE